MKRRQIMKVMWGIVSGIVILSMVAWGFAGMF